MAALENREEKRLVCFLLSVMTYVIIYMTYVIFIYLSTIEYRSGGLVLIVPCEIATKSVIPAVKALIAKELTEKHGLKQSEIAKLLDISQSAVSKYTTKTRGYVIRIDHVKEVRLSVDKIVNLVSNGEHERTTFLRLFCQTCTIIREQGLMCEFCQKTDPTIVVKGCGLCTNSIGRRKR